MKHTLCEWEENGYHDSDFFAAVWDDETERVESMLLGSTRFGGGTPAPPDCGPSEARRARAWLAEVIANLLLTEDQAAVLEPGKAQLQPGAIVRTKRIIRPKDIGPIPAGTVGEVTWIGSRPGRYYANGYNRPDARSNLRIRIRLDDGRALFAPADAVRLDRDTIGMAEARERGERLAREHQYGRALSGRHAWDSRNPARELEQSGALDAPEVTEQERMIG